MMLNGPAALSDGEFEALTRTTTPMSSPRQSPTLGVRRGSISIPPPPLDITKAGASNAASAPQSPSQATGNKPLGTNPSGKGGGS
jgi:hypothetical protein